MGNRGHNDSSSESDDWEDESWIVDCPCGVSHDDGEEMVECDECGVWVHTACCRVPKLLPSYVCDKCKHKKKQKEEESEVAQLLADLPSKPVSFEEKGVPRPEPFTPFRVPSNLPTEAKAHVTGIPGGDPSFFVGARKIFGRQLWTYSGYVPKRFNVDYDHLIDLREDTAELLRDMPEFVPPPYLVNQTMKRKIMNRLQAKLGGGMLHGDGDEPDNASTYNEMTVVPSREDAKEGTLLSDETFVQDVTPGGKQVKNNHVRKLEGKHNKYRHKPKLKDEKTHSQAKRAREDGLPKEPTSKKKSRVSGDAVKSDDNQEMFLKSEDAPLAPVIPPTSPKNPKAMKKLAVQEFMDGVVRICSRCENFDIPLGTRSVWNFGSSTDHETKWTCEKCGRVVGGSTPAGFATDSVSLKQEPESVVENAVTCSDVEIVDRKSIDKNDAAVKTPRSRDESKQRHIIGECSPNHVLHPKVSDYKDSDTKAADSDVQQPERKCAKEETSEVTFDKEPSAITLESPLKRLNRLGQEAEAGEILEVLDSSEQRALKRQSVHGESGEILACKIGTDSKFLPSDDLNSDTQVEKKTSKSSTTPSFTETRGQGSARTSGCLPASVREKFNLQQQRAVSSPSLPGQTGVNSAQKVVSPLSAGVTGGSAFPKVSHIEDFGTLQAHTQECPIQASKELEGLHKSQEGSQDVSLLSQSSAPAQRFETDSTQRWKGPSAEMKEQTRSEGPSPGATSQPPVLGASSITDAPEQKVTFPICQQARQSNGVGTYSRKSSAQTGVSASHTSEKATVNVRVPISTKSDSKVLAGQMKSPLSSGTSSSPTSPLVTTPSSKLQPHSNKAPGSPPPQKSFSGGITPKSSSIHGGSKVSASGTSGSKQVASLTTSKSVPTPSPSPLSSKAVNTAKASSRSSSLPVSKSSDVGSKSSTLTSRGGNHGAPSSGALNKESGKNASHSKSSVVGKVVSPTISKPPSSSKHGNVMVKTQSKLSGSKATLQPSKPSGHTKSSVPPSVPKRSPPTALSSPATATTTLKDEELALLLHQELNSSPRVPRVPRVRQAGASLQLTSASQASVSSTKGNTGAASSAGGSHKLPVEHHLALRRRNREDRVSSKDGERNVGRSPADDSVKGEGRKADDGKIDDRRSISEAMAVNISLPDVKDSSGGLGSQYVPESSARHHLFGRGSLSIIVPGAEDVLDGEKKSPAERSIATLPGLIEEVLNSRGQQISYEDVCEAILPHWPKLRKSNGERYAYLSHHQAVLESLRSRPAWAHLVERPKGLQTYIARKRRRNESRTLSDSESDPAPNGIEHQAYEGLSTGKSSKRSRVAEGEKGDGGGSSGQKYAADVSKGKRRVRRRRRLAMDDGTDGEDEPRTKVEKDSGVAKETTAKGVSQEEEPDSISSPSSEEAVSNYSEEDEEMVVHRGMRNRRPRGDESTCSEDDMD
ncbi:hypothetical protein Mapa_007999 [Marchantia paleacea]|nr:hypothetical protein Mapa_007999 [Marchantia paleacea]